jgi:hypothetical protein
MLHRSGDAQLTALGAVDQDRPGVLGFLNLRDKRRSHGRARARVGIAVGQLLVGDQL